MELSPTKASILCFPQKFTGNKIMLNILFIPREDPFEPFVSNLPAGTDTSAFSTARLKFAARLIPSPELLPDPTQAGEPIPLLTTTPAGVSELFVALKNTYNITLPSNELKPHVSNHTFIRKYLPRSYRQAFDFSHPRSPKFGVTDDAYLCALKQPASTAPKSFTTSDVSWGKVFALLLRQPELTKKLGMVYTTELTLPSTGYFKDGGWLYIELADSSDYYEQTLLSPTLIKKYAARIPRLTSDRILFAPLQFLVSGQPQAGNFDPLFIEAADFDDGFANIVHCNQPQKANLILEADQDGMPPIKDFGIRIGWEDEQLLEWQNRLLRRPDHSGLPPAPGNEILDVPLGILSYRIDVRDIDAAAESWYSLNKATGILKVGEHSVGPFTGELGVEVGPVQMDGLKEGIFWLPSYFAQWDGNSVVMRDDKAAQLFGIDSSPDRLKAVDIDQVPLKYGNTYQFRVRFSDMSGGGPLEGDEPFITIPSQTASCRFRRFVPPGKPLIPAIDHIEIPGEDDDIPYEPPQNYAIYRPLLGYPALLYTQLNNAFSLLQADITQARKERREPAYPDPDVDSLKIEVFLQGLGMDDLLSRDLASNWYPLYTTSRQFNTGDLTAPLNLNITFVDTEVIKFDDAADLGDFPIPVENGPLLLPTARNVKIVVTPVCRPDPTLKYFGADHVRFGRPSTILTRQRSNDESALFIEDIPAKHIKAILLQPDPTPGKSLEAQMNLLGKKTETPENLVSRLAAALDLDHHDAALIAKPGQRVVFGCCKEIRHSLSPEHGSITISSKADIINQWIPAVKITINRDWSWSGFSQKCFTIRRNGQVVGTIEDKRVANDIHLQNPDRTKTTFIFLDAVDPKPENDQFPEILHLQYEVSVTFIDTPVSGDPDPVAFDIKLPVAVKPAQIPKVVSAGIALSPYERDSKGYSWTHSRKKMLWIEFEEPVADPNDNYFVYVKAYAPDPVLINTGGVPIDPKETSPYLDPEYIRMITPGQPDDRSGLNAMQAMVPAIAGDGVPSPRHFLVPLPSWLSDTSPELFGFFVYDICVGHSKIWSTAQARFGRSITLTGVQHPAPALICSAIRNKEGITVSAPYAMAVYEGKNLTPWPATEMWALLYAQVMLVNGQDHRNILLDRKILEMRNANDPGERQPVGFHRWSDREVKNLLLSMGIATNTPLSCMAIELFPIAANNHDPLGGDLGYTRIYRASQLEPVPDICCADC